MGRCWVPSLQTGGPICWVVFYSPVRIWSGGLSSPGVQEICGVRDASPSVCQQDSNVGGRECMALGMTPPIESADSLRKVVTLGSALHDGRCSARPSIALPRSSGKREFLGHGDVHSLLCRAEDISLEPIASSRNANARALHRPRVSSPSSPRARSFRVLLRLTTRWMRRHVLPGPNRTPGLDLLLVSRYRSAADSMIRRGKCTRSRDPSNLVTTCAA